jgi:hypothetical protein
MYQVLMFIYHVSADMAVNKHTDITGEGSMKSSKGPSSVIGGQKLVMRK